MSVYKPIGSDVYVYDFRLDGVRYSATTAATELEDALAAERAVRDGIVSISPFCRQIMRRARRNLPSRSVTARGHVYVVRSGYLIKIGHSRDPQERLRSIRTMLPEGCELVMCFPGDQKTEKALHQEFSACHYKKEWFFLCGKLKAFIADYERQIQASDAEIATESPEILSASPLRA